MKKYIICLTIGILFCSLIGCLSQTEKVYTYRQSADQIESIEVLRKEYDSNGISTPMYVLRTFAPSEFQTVLEGLSNIPASYRLNPPATGFGLYIIRITYKNGEADFIGDYNTGYMTVDGEIFQERWFFNTEPYYDFISELLGEEITDYTYG